MDSLGEILKVLSNKTFEIKFSVPILELRWLHALSFVKNTYPTPPTRKKTKDAIYYNNIRATQITGDKTQSIVWHKRDKQYIGTIHDFDFSLVSDKAITQPFQIIPPPISRRDNCKLTFQADTHKVIFVKSNDRFDFILDFTSSKDTKGYTNEFIFNTLYKFKTLFSTNPIQKVDDVLTLSQIGHASLIVDSPFKRDESVPCESIPLTHSNISELTVKKYAVIRKSRGGEPGSISFRNGSCYIICVSSIYIVNIPISTQLLELTKDCILDGELHLSTFTIMDIDGDEDFSERYIKVVKLYEFFTESLRYVIKLGIYRTTSKIATDVMNTLDGDENGILGFKSIFSNQYYTWDPSPLIRLKYSDNSLITRDLNYLDYPMEDLLSELDDESYFGFTLVNNSLKCSQVTTFNNTAKHVELLFEFFNKPLTFHNLLENMVMNQKVHPGPFWNPFPEPLVETSGSLDSTAKAPNTALPSGFIKPTNLTDSIIIKTKEIVSEINFETIGVLLERELAFFPQDKFQTSVVTNGIAKYETVVSFGSIEKIDPISLIYLLNNCTTTFQGYYINTSLMEKSILKNNGKLEIDRKTNLSWNSETREVFINVKGSDSRPIASDKIYDFFKVAERYGWRVEKETKGFGYSSHCKITDCYTFFSMVRENRQRVEVSERFSERVNTTSSEFLKWREIPNSTVIFEDIPNCDWRVWKNCVVIDECKKVIYIPSEKSTKSTKLLLYYEKGNSDFKRVIAQVGGVKILEFPLKMF